MMIFWVLVTSFCIFNIHESFDLVFILITLTDNFFDYDFSRKPESSSLLSRDTTSIEDELTQYTLTPTELTDSSASKDKVHTICE